MAAVFDQEKSVYKDEKSKLTFKCNHPHWDTAANHIREIHRQAGRLPLDVAFASYITVQVLEDLFNHIRILNEITRIAPEHFGHTSGSTSQNFCINSAQFYRKAFSVSCGSRMHGILSSASAFFVDLLANHTMEG